MYENYLNSTKGRVDTWGDGGSIIWNFNTLVKTQFVIFKTRFVSAFVSFYSSTMADTAILYSILLYGK